MDSQSPREELLVNLNPPYEGFTGQAAMPVDNWKLIVGLPNCSLALCPDGWVHLNGTI